MADRSGSALVLPSEETLAFAHTICKSWRESGQEVSLREYIKLLRQHIAQGRRENALSNVYRHLDRSAYWRSVYEQTQDTLYNARDEIVDLKRQLDVLKANEQARPSTARPGTARPGTGRPGSPSKKRKKQDEDIIPVPRSPKKSKRDASPVRALPPATDRGVDAEFEEAGEVGKILLRSVYHIHVIFRTSKKTDPPELAYHLVQAASSISQIVEREIHKISSEPVDAPDRISTALTITSRAIASVLAGCTRLSHVADGPTVQGQVIYAMIVMFRKLLQSFQLLATAEAGKIENGETSSNSTVVGSARSGSPDKAKSKAKASKPSTMRENPLLSLYSKFLGSVIDGIDPKVDANRSIFEGFACCLLQQVGDRLYTITFGRSRDASLEAEITSASKQSSHDNVDATKLNRDGGSVTSQQPQPAPLSPMREDLKQSLLEAPYLMHLMQRLISRAPSHLGTLSTTKSNRARNTNNNNSKAPLKGALAFTAKECLQRTLINCTFGIESQQDDDDGFRDFLKMPQRPEGELVLQIPKGKEEGVGEWFKEELWKCLGWEILAKDGEWN